MAKKKPKNWAKLLTVSDVGLEKYKNRKNYLQFLHNNIASLINRKKFSFSPTLFDRIFKLNWAKLRTVPGVGLDAYVYATCEDLHHPKHKSIVLAH